MKLSPPGLIVFFVCLSSGTASFLKAQSNDPPLEDKRLTIHTLIREDFFAGWRADNEERLKRGEANLEKLLKSRPEAKADLLAWKGANELYHATVANKNEDAKDYEEHLQQARRLFGEAKKTNPNSGGVYALIGAGNAYFADRLADKDQKASWEQAYESYQILWKAQGTNIESMPVHIGGELLAGLAMSSQRLGKTTEVPKHLDKIIEVYKDSPYAKEAQRWKDDPKIAQSRSIICKNCHSSGRLKTTLKRLDGQ